MTCPNYTIVPAFASSAHVSIFVIVFRKHNLWLVCSIFNVSGEIYHILMLWFWFELSTSKWCWSLECPGVMGIFIWKLGISVENARVCGHLKKLRFLVYVIKQKICMFGSIGWRHIIYLTVFSFVNPTQVSSLNRNRIKI